MTTLREVAAEELEAYDQDVREVESWSFEDMADGVIAAIFDPKYREALRAELVERRLEVPWRWHDGGEWPTEREVVMRAVLALLDTSDRAAGREDPVIEKARREAWGWLSDWVEGRAGNAVPSDSSAGSGGAKLAAHVMALALGGVVGGHVRKDGWSCVCGAEGSARNATQAGIDLYVHRTHVDSSAGSGGAG